MSTETEPMPPGQVARTIMQAAASRLNQASTANTDQEVLETFNSYSPLVRQWLLEEARLAATVKLAQVDAQITAQRASLTRLVEAVHATELENLAVPTASLQLVADDKPINDR